MAGLKFPRQFLSDVRRPFREWVASHFPLLAFMNGNSQRFREAIKLPFGYSITDSFDNDDLTMMQDSVSQGCGEGGIIVECFCPLVWRPVGGDHHRAGLITSTQDLKQQVRPSFVNGQESKFINDEEFGFEIFFHGLQERVIAERSIERIDDAGGRAEEGGIAFLTGLVSQGQRQMGFSDSWLTDKQDIASVFYKTEVEERDNALLGYLLCVAEIELLKGLNHRESCFTEPYLRGALFFLQHFFFEQPFEEVEVGQIVPLGDGSLFLVTAANSGQPEIRELIFETFFIHLLVLCQSGIVTCRPHPDGYPGLGWCRAAMGEAAKAYPWRAGVAG